MWIRIVLVGLLCWSADGEQEVTCRNHSGGAVDWFIMYKVPKLNNQGTTGLEYLYMDSAGKKMETSTDHKKLIDKPDGVLGHTLRPLFTTSMTRDFGFITYSDQAPGCNAVDTFGHSKGLVMMDKTRTGVWLLHSLPQFPFLRDPNRFYPPSGAAKAQTFICVTFNYDQFQKIGEHLLDINAFTFDDHIPDDFYKELKDLRRTGNNIRAPRVNKVNSKFLTSAAGASFRSIAKKQYDAGEPEDEGCDDEPPTKKPKPEPSPTKEPKDEYVGDLYLTIAETYRTPLKVQTWCGRDEHCYSGGPQLSKVTSVKTKLDNKWIEWGFGVDHSKWCVSGATANDLVCITDVNRGLKQYKRPGGGLCFNHKEASQLFKGVIAKSKQCP